MSSLSRHRSSSSSSSSKATFGVGFGFGGLLFHVGTTITSSLALAVSLFLWRNVVKLQRRIEFLEARESRAEHKIRRISIAEKKKQAACTAAAAAASETGALVEHAIISERPTSQYPEPEVVVLDEFEDLPLRFEKAGKGDLEEGRRRFAATLEWRRDHEMDTALYRPWPHFELIKKHYPHFFHSRGKQGEPVFYEQPPKTDLKALKTGGVDLHALLSHYAMICEFQWQYVTRDDDQKSIYVIDLDGMGMYDFVGDCKDFVREASKFASANYPERAGVVLVINVPYWFKMVWNVVSKWVDPVTLQKIFILRGKAEVLHTLAEKIPMENIPPEYGGQSPYQLGESLEEQLLRSLITHNNQMANGQPCPNKKGADHDEPCRFCNFRYARNY